MAAAKEYIEQRKSAGGGNIDLTRYNPGLPQVAVAWALFPGMMAPPHGNGMMPLPVPLCWSHMLTLQLQETALSLGSAADAARLGSGPGGAWLLGQGNG